MLYAIRSAQAPDKFTIAFLESLDFKSSSDRLIIRDPYEDLFRINISAPQLSKSEVVNKFKTLSQGKKPTGWRHHRGRDVRCWQDSRDRVAEVHWYEASSIGKKEFKIKGYLG